MKKFKDLILEEETAQKETKLNHLPHLHRLANVFPKGEDTDEEKSYGGHRGVETSDDFLNKLHDFMRGKKVPNNYTFSEKQEGAPSFLARRYGGATSVAYKGAAGKPDKMLSSHEDIDRAYGHAPGLADKMHRLLDHVGKILPDSQKIFQGDYMGDEDSVQQEGEQKTSQPNSIKYHFPSDTNLGKIMVSLHTMYDRGGAKPIDRKTRGEFSQHPDVYHIDPTINVNPANYTPEEQGQFANHMENARKAYSKIKPEDEEFLRRHGDMIENFVNRSVREGIEPSHDNFVAHMNEKSAKKIAGLKSDKGRAAESLKHSDKIKDIVENKRVFDSSIELMKHQQAAGEVLRKVAAKNTPHMTSINGEATEGEGVVLARKNSDGTTTMAKQVNPEFTKFNLQAGGNMAKAKEEAKQKLNNSYNLTGRLLELYAGSSNFKPLHNSFRKSVHIEPRKGSEQIPVRSSVAASRNQHQQHAARTRNVVAVREEAAAKPIVMASVRMNPFHQGHGELVNAVTSEAKRIGGDHKIILSHSQDATKNPLTVEQKLKHAKRAFPGTNFEASTPEHPTLLQHLSKAYAAGHREVTIVSGSDRDAFHDLAKKYNGVESKHGYYNMKINFKQAGEERDEGGSGVASYSASKMRSAAASNDRKTFHAMAPSGMSTKHKDEMMSDVKKGMNLKEDISVSSSRGLGYVTGNPAAGSDQLSSYFDSNAKNSAEVSLTISDQMKKSQSNTIKFKDYKPTDRMARDKSLTYWDTDENGDPLEKKRRNNDFKRNKN